MARKSFNRWPKTWSKASTAFEALVAELEISPGVDPEHMEVCNVTKREAKRMQKAPQD